jgi:hypothetical protein
MGSCYAHAVEQKPFDEHPAERRQQKVLQKHLDGPTCSTVVVARRGADEDNHAEKQRDRQVLQDLFAERSSSRKHSVPFAYRCADVHTIVRFRHASIHTVVGQS